MEPFKINCNHEFAAYKNKSKTEKDVVVPVKDHCNGVKGAIAQIVDKDGRNHPVQVS